MPLCNFSHSFPNGSTNMDLISSMTWWMDQCGLEEYCWTLNSYRITVSFILSLFLFCRKIVEFLSLFCEIDHHSLAFQRSLCIIQSILPCSICCACFAKSYYTASLGQVFGGSWIFGPWWSLFFFFFFWACQIWNNVQITTFTHFKSKGLVENTENWISNLLSILLKRI